LKLLFSVNLILKIRTIKKILPIIFVKNSTGIIKKICSTMFYLFAVDINRNEKNQRLPGGEAEATLAASSLSLEKKSLRAL
jgi:hypothetical protein